MGIDGSIQDGGVAVGDLILEGLESSTVVDKSGWTVESVNRVARRLMTVLASLWGYEKRFLISVFWAQNLNGFTTPGNRIFLSRRLLERCRTDDMIAFFLAHEMAHHQLGHFGKMEDWDRRFSGYHPAWILAAQTQFYKRLFFGPERM